MSAAARSEAADDDEHRRKEEKPQADLEEACRVARELFNLTEATSAKQLESYDDKNFCLRGRLRGGEPAQYTLKLHNGVESVNVPAMEAQNAIMLHLEAQGFCVPAPRADAAGAHIAFTELSMRGTLPPRRHAARLLAWVGGLPMNEAKTIELATLRAAGVYLGRMTAALADFDHVGAHRVHIWDLQNTLLTRGFLHAITDAERKATIEGVMVGFETLVVPRLAELRWGVLQADFNDANIILDRDAADAAIVGVIDFGDMVYSMRVNEVAIAMAYAMVSTVAKRAVAVGRPQGVAECAFALLEGFCARETEGEDEGEAVLTAAELEVLPTLVACRLAISVTMGAYSYSKEPENKYLLVHAQPGWDAIGLWTSSDPAELVARAKAAAGVSKSS